MFSNLDDTLAYETRKIVRIRDKRLGIVHLIFVSVIALYVVGFQILYLNGHFEKRDVDGTARMTIQQPTRNGCNPNKPYCKSDFHALTELPYCSVYAGVSNEVAPEHRRACTFADQHTLAPFGMLQGEMLVPTRIDQMREHKGCSPEAANGYTCDNEYEIDSDHHVTYVADIERYTILVSHTFSRRHIEGNNVNIQGHLMVCEESQDKDDKVKVAATVATELLTGISTCRGTWVKKPIECINSKCPFLKKGKPSSFLQNIESTFEDSDVVAPERSSSHLRPGSKRVGVKTALVVEEEDEDSDGVNPADLAAGGYFAIPQGDVFRVSKLLELSGLSLDNSFNSEGEPLREAGTVILIEVVYTNLHPFLSSFGVMDVQYYYKVSRRPMDEMKTELYAARQPDYLNSRIIEDRHGLYVVVKIGGEFGFFSIVYLLVMLTTTVALISAAGVITDKLAVYVMPEKDTYYSHKYEVTDLISEENDGQRKIVGLKGNPYDGSSMRLKSLERSARLEAYPEVLPLPPSATDEVNDAPRQIVGGAYDGDSVKSKADERAARQRTLEH
mmetsp:Transcript_15263/g.24893  ORF Transcript_15263/g.24893 Transcript_15263/m.24893 type:complete len:558 (+) Transcript_15263:74-1747(+)